MNLKRIYAWVIGLALTSAGYGTTLRVPADYATIQAAFDNLSDHDTVLVEPAIYNESLQAPDSISFVLLGIVNPGGNPEKPVVDPSPLEGSTHLACLRLPSNCRAIINDMIFRNGPQMFPRDHSSDVGGILNNALDATMGGCTFDSTYKGLYSGIQTSGTQTVSDCDFIDNVNGCLWDLSPSRTSIFNSTFSASGDRRLWLSDSALVQNCQFNNMPDGGEWMWLVGPGITIRGCTFGPTIVPAYVIIWTATSYGCTIEQNTFHDLELTGAAIWFNGILTDTSIVRGNVFRNNRGVTAQTAGGGLLLEQQGSTRPNIIISDNVFDSCRASTANGFGSVHIGQPNVRLEHNHFVGPDVAMPNVHVFANRHVIMHECFFSHTGWAMRSDSTIDAEFNWWGNATGPYHSQLNPLGLGDSITGPVDFTPWLTDTILAAPEPASPLPLSAQLGVYPNPFNATATLLFTVGAPGVYDVDLCNTLGQRVLMLWSGPVTGAQQISINGQTLASGLYFVRVSAHDMDHFAALAKIVLLK